MLFEIVKALVNDDRFEAVFKEKVEPIIYGGISEEKLKALLPSSLSPQLASAAPIAPFKQTIDTKANLSYLASSHVLDALDFAKDHRIATLREFWVNIKPLFDIVNLDGPIQQQGKVRKTLTFNMVLNTGVSKIPVSFGIKSYSKSNAVTVYKSGAVAKKDLIVTDPKFLVKFFVDLLDIHSVKPGTSSYKLSDISKPVVVNRWRITGSNDTISKSFDSASGVSLYMNAVYKGYKPSAGYNPRKLMGSLLNRQFDFINRLPGNRFEFTDNAGGVVTIILD